MAAVVYICCYLLRYHDLPVDKSSTQGNKENDNQLSEFSYTCAYVDYLLLCFSDTRYLYVLKKCTILQVV